MQEIKGHQQSPLLQAFFQHVVAGFNLPSKPAVGVSFEHFDFEPSPAPAKFEARHLNGLVLFSRGLKGFLQSHCWLRHGRSSTKIIVTAVLWLPGEPTNKLQCRWFEPPLGIHAGDLVLHNCKVAGPAALKNGSTPGDGRSRHSIGAFRR